MSQPVYLSLLIPVYNEENGIKGVVEKLSSLPWPFAVEFVFVDDGSSDRTVEYLQEALKVMNTKDGLISVKMQKQEKNKGKGAAIQKCIELATGELCVVQDADFEYDPKDILSLVVPIQKDEADIVYGSRFKKNAIQVHRTFHYFVNRLLTFLSNLFSGLYFTDMETCYKIFRSDIIKNIHLHSPRFGFEPEVTAHIARLNVRVVELPVRYYPRNYLEGKKITWKDGGAALWHIFYFNMIFDNSKRFKETMPKKYLIGHSKWL